jgi:hypothetical protein
METIDDDCDDLGVSFVAVRDRALAAKYDFYIFVYYLNIVIYSNSHSTYVLWDSQSITEQNQIRIPTCDQIPILRPDQFPVPFLGF